MILPDRKARVQEDGQLASIGKGEQTIIIVSLSSVPYSMVFGLRVLC